MSPCASGHKEPSCKWKQHFHDLLHSAQLGLGAPANTAKPKPPPHMPGPGFQETAREEGELLCSPGTPGRCQQQPLLHSGAGLMPQPPQPCPVWVEQCQPRGPPQRWVKGAQLRGGLRRQSGHSRHGNNKRRGCGWVRMYDHTWRSSQSLELRERARFLHFIHCCPVLNLGLQLLPAQKRLHFSNQQLMSQGDAWGENTPSKAESASTRVINPPSLQGSICLRGPSDGSVPRSRGRAHPARARPPCGAAPPSLDSPSL